MPFQLLLLWLHSWAMVPLLGLGVLLVLVVVMLLLVRLTVMLMIVDLLILTFLLCISMMASVCRVCW
jgi:hypothetical protein